MQSHPDIAALRLDDEPQREAQAALSAAQEAWAQQARSRAVFADLALYAQGKALADCPALAGLFGAAAGLAWMQEWVGPMLRGLHCHPLGHIPMRHFTNGVLSSLLLGRSGETTLAIVAVDGAALARQAASPSVSFAPLDSHECVLAGGGTAQIIACARPGAPQTALTPCDTDLRPGTRVALDGARQALRLRAVDGVLVSLRLQRRQPQGHVTHEYDLASGRLLHRAAGGARDSRHALMVNLLGRMGRRDAAPVLASLAAQMPASDDLRWQALRETLGLDTARGFRLLCTIAGCEGDTLAAAARALRAQLLERHPMLAEIA